ncbi:hypothetical protein [Flavobacterium sp. K5-23]|uniref:hypothetical protein n=1 Tax=Flavobacterium sp. K5-23 TaxID=2746225 RepID=UPI00200D7F8C|nr:hypothetical protein [Flavobacterium sp. K5-23]UQD55786.1 hypothetical protein FLAK523_04990 [Flavobacterium sp. K5-23]
MKKKQIIISLSLIATVLFSILFQSLHDYTHFVKLLTQTECRHKYNVTNTEITHQHHKYEQCVVCHLSLGSYIPNEIVAYKFQSDYKFIPCFFTTFKKINSFSGSLYSLRGPPARIV